MTNSKPVLIRYKDGAEYQIESAAIARKAHPDAEIVSYFDGTPIEDEKPKAAPVTRDKDGD